MENKQELMAKMVPLTKTVADLELFRQVAGEHEPLDVQQAEPYGPARDAYWGYVEEHWDNPEEWFIDTMHEAFSPNDFDFAAIAIGDYADEWDGTPTESLAARDIQRLRRKFGVTEADYSAYFALTPKEKNVERDAFLENRYLEQMSELAADEADARADNPHGDWFQEYEEFPIDD